ncbi:hypothetical protein ABPG73_006349 [Tetrahymena malaccensis]
MDQTKEQIFSFIDKINFFNQNILNGQNPNNDLHDAQIENKPNFSSELMQLISNKSNFCSAEFLNSIKLQLDKLNPLLEDISTQNMFIEGKQPIEFQQLDEQKMNEISDYVKHIVELQNNTVYHCFKKVQAYFNQQLKDTKINQAYFEMDQTKDILNDQNPILDKIRIQTENKYNFSTKLMSLISNKSNFCSSEFLNSIKQQLDMLNPFLESVVDQNMFIKGKQPIEFQQLSEEKMNKISEYVKHVVQMQNNTNYEKFVQQSQYIKDLQKIMQNKLNFISEISKKTIMNHLIETYPYLLNRGNTQIIQQQDKFETFNQLDDQMIDDLFLLMKQKQQIQNSHNVSNKRDSQANCMSNMILEKDKKYIFRVQFKSICNQNYFQIGLMQKKNLNIQKGCQEQYFAQFEIENGKIKLDCKRFTNYLKGKDLNLNNLSTIFELRVWLNGQIMQISDFPDNNYIISINNEKLQELKSVQNLSFFQQLYNQQDTYILTEALVVEEFDD